jgi:hypothetical protein
MAPREMQPETACTLLGGRFDGQRLSVEGLPPFVFVYDKGCDCTCFAFPSWIDDALLAYGYVPYALVRTFRTDSGLMASYRPLHEVVGAKDSY